MMSESQRLTLSADAPSLFAPLLASPELAAGAEAATAVASSADMESFYPGRESSQCVHQYEPKQPSIDEAQAVLC